MTSLRTLSLVSLLALGACAPLINLGGSEPATAYGLRYPGGRALAAEGAPVIYVDEPVMTEGLGGRDIVVRGADGSQSVLKGGRWTAPASDMVRYYLVQALEDHTGARMIGEGGLDINAACRTHITVWHFEMVPGAGGTPDKAVVGLELSLVHLDTGEMLFRNRFDRTADITGNEPSTVVAAFQYAMEGLSGELAEGMKDKVAACGVETAPAG
ncbi:ABC-type transport auxiliary lipoprotein family protein [Gimibacter soli]|uniref:ABC-type transport auxiliary lipoprotein family protein n=1 Tax=Gimibacter soli TaxID=3024400 RepID=A0AAF0BI47_9PROT|nr:ABC-type transport auxiliary lipoprotein family protein [Gimibacter soli]WCL54943.1 ABC-type transport auxiliary lipoprotein family protein [Gimibacter soli]